MSPVEVLQAAKETLIRSRWWRGESDRGAGHCAVTAVAMCNGWLELMTEKAEARRHLAYAITNTVPESTVDVIVSFNDNPNTRFSDLMVAFDDAILLAKEAEAA